MPTVAWRRDLATPSADWFQLVVTETLSRIKSCRLLEPRLLSERPVIADHLLAVSALYELQMHGGGGGESDRDEARTKIQSCCVWELGRAAGRHFLS